MPYSDKPVVDFKDQVVLISGAAGALGRAYALAYAKKGARLVLNDFGADLSGKSFSSDSLKSLYDELLSYGSEAVLNNDSVSSEEGGQAMVDAALSKFGRLDVLINNAGILRDSSFAKMRAEDWDAVVDVHLKGAFCLTAPAFRLMKEQNYGRIIFTSSAAALYGNFGQCNYVAAKMGLIGFMLSLAIEGRKYNININSIAPLAASRMTEELLPPDLLAKMKPETIVPLVLWLSSMPCRESGSIFNIGLGRLNKVEIMTSKGISFKPDLPLDLESLLDSWADITDMSESSSYKDLGDFILSVLS